MALIGDKKVNTSEKGENILDTLRDFTNLDLSVLAKIAIAVSLKNWDKSINSKQKFDSYGRNLRGINIFGDDALLYYSVLCSINNKQIPDNEFFSGDSLIKDHLENGLLILDRYYKESGRDKLNFFERLISDIKIPKDYEQYTSTRLTKIPVGKTIGDNEEIVLEFNNSKKYPNSHIAIMGKSGVGKTQFLLKILSEIKKKSPKTNMIIFDYKGDISANTDFIGDTQFHVYTLGKRSLPVNPFILEDYDEQEINMSAREKAESFSSIDRKFGPVQKQNLTDIIKIAYQGRKNEEIKYPNFDEILKIAKNKYEEEGKETDTLLSKLKDLSEFKLFSNDDQSIIKSMVNSSFIVDLSKLPVLKELVVYLAIERLYKEMASLPDSPVNDGIREIRTILVIDEAHNYLSQKNSFLQKLVREGRSKGVFVFFASQSPNDFMIDDFNFTEFLQFLFVFNSDVDTNAIKTFLAVNDREAKKLKAEISRFKPFQCIMKTEDKYLKFNSYKYFEE